MVRAEREGNPARARIARKQAAALQPRLPRLQVRLSSGDAPAGLIVNLDGNPLPRSVLDTAVYVDPGEHEITAVIPGREQFSLQVRLSESELRVVEIPALAAAPESQPPPGTQPGGAAAPPVAESAGQRGRPGRARRVAGLAVGGAGVIALAVSLGVGATAISAWDEAFESGACDAETLVCTPAGQEQTDTARNRALLSNVLLGAGATAVAAGALLYFTAPRARDRRGARIVPLTAPDAVGVAVVGGF
jgi:hypothetical protein